MTYYTDWTKPLNKFEPGEIVQIGKDDDAQFYVITNLRNGDAGQLIVCISLDDGTLADFGLDTPAWPYSPPEPY